MNGWFWCAEQWMEIFNQNERKKVIKLIESRTQLNPNNTTATTISKKHLIFFFFRTDKKWQQMTTMLMLMMMGKERANAPANEMKWKVKRNGEKNERKSIYWYYTKIQFKNLQPFHLSIQSTASFDGPLTPLHTFFFSLLLRWKIIVYATRTHTAVRQSGKNENKRIERERKKDGKGEKIDRIYKN